MNSSLRSLKAIWHQAGLQTRKNDGDSGQAGFGAVGPISGRKFSLLLKPPSSFSFNCSASREGEHDVPCSAGAPNAVCQECCHQFSLDCQVIFLLR